MKRFHLSLMLLVFAFSGHSQGNSVLQAFKDLNEHYQNLTAFSMDFEMRYINQGGQVVMSQKGAVAHGANLHYTKVGSRITLLTDQHYVSVNGDNNLLVVNEFEAQKNKNKQTAQADLNISDMLDSLWLNQKNLSFKVIQSKSGTLRVFIEDNANVHFSAYEVLINTQKHQLMDFVYYFKTTENSDDLSKIQITYTNETSRPNLKAENLKVNYYLERKKNEWIPTERFKNYEIIDQTKIQPGL